MKYLVWVSKIFHFGFLLIEVFVAIDGYVRIRISIRISIQISRIGIDRIGDGVCIGSGICVGIGCCFLLNY